MPMSVMGFSTYMKLQFFLDAKMFFFFFKYIDFYGCKMRCRQMPIINETYEVIEHQCYKKTLKFVTKLNNHNLILEQIHPMS